MLAAPPTLIQFNCVTGQCILEEELRGEKCFWRERSKGSLFALLDRCGGKHQYLGLARSYHSRRIHIGKEWTMAPSVRFLQVHNLARACSKFLLPALCCRLCIKQHLTLWAYSGPSPQYEPSSAMRTNRTCAHAASADAETLCTCCKPLAAARLDYRSGR